MSQTQTIRLSVRDASGQRHTDYDAAADASWGETMKGLVATMDLPVNQPGAAGETVWTGLLERQHRHLHANEVNSEILQENDQVVLQPEVTAG